MARRDLSRTAIERGRRRSFRLTNRWLRSQCGRPWDDVFSELVARFDARTAGGRHLVFDGVLREVGPLNEDDRSAWCTFTFEIDAGGVLREGPRRRKPTKLPPWTDGFHAVKHAGRWWWIGDRIIGPCAQLTKCTCQHAYHPDGVARHFTRATLIRPMSPTDVGRLTSSPPRVRDAILWRGPVVDPADARPAR